MSQDTRKDPRAKIVSLNVRYKSATVDEFIENHSHDVSRGGLFIKTSTPFAQGTLLKFEIRLSSDQPVIAGVGRVVWKREPNQAASDRPAGMGVKFIKIDDRSRTTIERLVTTKADAGSAFAHAHTDEEVTTVRPSVPPRMELPSLKPTVSGMPAVAADASTGGVIETSTSVSVSPTPSFTNEFPGSLAPVAPPAGSGGGGFFPTTGGEQDMPPPQERTMMRQAAELLEEALKASGGSMEEVEQNPLFAGLPKSNPTGVALQPAEPREEQAMATIGGFPTSSPNAAPAVVTPAAAALAATEASESAPRRSTPPNERRSVPPGRASDVPARASLSARPVRATDLLADSAPKKGGGGILWAGLAVVAIGGGLAYAYQAGMLTEQAKQNPTASTSTVTQTAPPASSATAVATAQPTAPASVAAPGASSASPVASTAPATSVAALPTPTPAPPPEPVAKAITTPRPSAPRVPAKAAEKPAEAKPEEKPTEAKTPTETKPAETKPAEEKPAEKPAETKPAETKPAETKPAETKPAETKPAETKPAETKPAEATKPAEGETPPEKPKKPAKTTKPKEDSDNPY